MLKASKALGLNSLKITKRLSIIWLANARQAMRLEAKDLWFFKAYQGLKSGKLNLLQLFSRVRKQV